MDARQWGRRNKGMAMQTMDHEAMLAATKKEITDGMVSALRQQNAPAAVADQIIAALGRLTTSEWYELRHLRTVMGKDINDCVKTALIRARGHK